MTVTPPRKETNPNDNSSINNDNNNSHEPLVGTTTATATTTNVSTPGQSNRLRHDSLDAMGSSLFPTPLGNNSNQSVRICLEDEEFLLSPLVNSFVNDKTPTPHKNNNNNNSNNNNNNYNNDDDVDDDNDPHRPRIPSYPDDDNDYNEALLMTRHYHHHNYSYYQPQLNGLNYLNVATFLMNVFVSYGIGVWGLDGIMPTRWEIISQQYETLVTPAKWSYYYMWAPILAMEAMFAMAQLLPDYRARPIVQQGASYFFFYTCLIQTAWTLLFSFQFFLFSFASVLCAVGSLACLLSSQHYAQVRGHAPRMEYWLFQFPFILHFGWMVVMATVHFSLLARRFSTEANEGTQLAVDMVSLSILLAVAVYFLTGYPSGPDFVVPVVITWSYLGIAFRLSHPSETMVETYGYVVIVAVRDAAYFLAGTVGVLMVPGAVIWISHEYCTIQVVELAEDSFADDPLLSQLIS